jgi:hypothetical protein
MVDQRFSELREGLLRAGVATRKIRRAILEIESHFQQLVDEEVARGTSDHCARSEAHRRLGSNHTLVQHYAARPEFRAWSRRWPAIWFTLVALAAYVALSISSLAILHTVVEHMRDYLRHVYIAPQVTYRIDLAARIVFLWLFPWFVAIAFAVLAYRRRVALHWPVVGIVVISILASLINVTVTLTGGPTPGEYGAGIGFSTQSLPGQMTRAAIIASLVAVPLWLAMRRLERNSRVN